MQSKTLIRAAASPLLMALLLWIGMAHLALHVSLKQVSGSSNGTIWSEPAHSGNTRYAPIGSAVWNIDFSPMEGVLWRIQADPNGVLVVNSETADLLEEVYKKIPRELDDRDMQRLLTLLKKSLPSGYGMQFVELLKNYVPYKLKQNLHLLAINQAVYEAKLVLLESSLRDIEQLQSNYFEPEAAVKLFGKSNAIYHYFMQSRLISINHNWSDVQRREKMRVLQDEYKSVLSRGQER